MGNGTIDVSTLSPVPGQSTLRLQADPAASWGRVRTAVQAAYGWTPVLTDAYRDYATQEKIFRQRYTTTYLAGRSSKIWNGQRWYLKAGYAMAAVPGTSNHGLGTTVDVSGLGGFGATRFKQFAAVAASRGWNNVEGASINEAWHWSYNSANDVYQTSGGGTTVPTTPSVPVVVSPTIPAPTSLEDEDMAKLIQRGSEPSIYLSAPALGTHYHVVNEEELEELKAYYGNVESLPARSFDVRRQAALSVEALRNAGIVGTKVGDTGTLAQTVRDTRVIARRTEAPIAQLQASLKSVGTELGRIGTRLKEISGAPAKVRHWYREYLGREATSAETDKRTAQIVDGNTLDQHQTAIATSAEAKSARETYTKAQFKAILGRDATAAEVATYRDSSKSLATIKNEITALKK